MSRPSRVALSALMGVALAGALALGWAWHRDRTRHWEEPAWAEDRFVRLSVGQRADPGRPATWMMPVNPRCPHCLATLRLLHAEWLKHVRSVRLVALIVDAPARPGAEALRAMPRLPVWWDRDGVWRKRWGHRLYGELIEFDPAGRYLRTIVARDALPLLMLAAPGDSLAPATIKKGGT
jgi:hypothetical protein